MYDEMMCNNLGLRIWDKVDQLKRAKQIKKYVEEVQGKKKKNVEEYIYRYLNGAELPLSDIYITEDHGCGNKKIKRIINLNHFELNVIQKKTQKVVTVRMRGDHYLFTWYCGLTEEVERMNAGKRY